MIHLDFSRYKVITFDTFLNRFEIEVVRQLVEASKKWKNNQLDDSIKASLGFQFAPKYLQHLLKMTASTLVNNLCSFRISDDFRNILIDLINSGELNWDSFIEVLEQQGFSHNEAQLRLLHEMSRTKEREEAHDKKDDLSREGITVKFNYKSSWKYSSIF